MFATLPIQAPMVSTAGFGRGAEIVIEQSYTAFNAFTSAITTEALKQRFNRLRDAWREESFFSSKHGAMLSSSAYLSIIAMGKDALPFIFNEMRQQPEHWFIALNAITGINPVKKENRGDINAMTQDWLNWAVQHRYVAA